MTKSLFGIDECTSSRADRSLPKAGAVQTGILDTRVCVLSHRCEVVEHVDGQSQNGSVENFCITKEKIMYFMEVSKECCVNVP